MKKTFSILAAAFMLFAACDKVDNPVTGNGGGGGDTSTVVTRKVLLEDYTGHRCGTCPPAGAEAVKLKNQYGDKLIPIAVHAGFLAKPSSTPYTYDFRTPDGNAYELAFNLIATPTGLINRRNFPTSTHFVSWGAWSSNIGAIVNDKADAKMEITNIYNSATRQVNITVTTDMLNNKSGLYKLVVLVVEDSVIKPQLDNTKTPPDIMNYVHRHVLRGSVNSSWGDTLFSGTALSGAQFIKNYSYTLNAAWDDKHCEIVAFIYDADVLSTKRYEVLQVEDEHVK